MKHVNHAARLLLLTVLICALLIATVVAANSDTVWVTLAGTSDGATAQIVSDTAVTDGVVTLTYDSSMLTYESVTVVEDYVAMYAVNASEDGTVRISWVAPGPYEADPAGTELIQVNFSGDAAAAVVTLSGSAHDADGKDVAVEGEAKAETPPDETDTTAATTEPTTEPTTATTEPTAVVTEPTTAATEPTAAVTEPTTAATEPTVAATESTETESTEPVATETVPTEPNSSDTPKTGDGFMLELLIGMMVCSAVAAAAVTILYKRRDNR